MSDGPATDFYAGEPTIEMRTAYTLLREMSGEQRARLFCWFCPGCFRYVGPGDSCPGQSGRACEQRTKTRQRGAEGTG